MTVIHALKTLADNLEKLNEKTVALGSEDVKAMNAVQEIRNQLSLTESAVESINAELENALSCLKYTMTMQGRQLSMFLEEAGKRLPEHFSGEEISSLAGIKEHMLDALYVSFEDRFRGTREDIKERAKVYLPYIKEVNAGTEDSQVLDIGCGRGEWLELLKEEELHAIGVDINKIFINQCRDRGFNVIEGDAVSYLRTLSDGSLGAVTGLHIVEHLQMDKLMSLLNETVRVLRSGGIAIFETPNPENLIVGACNFYLDPTHLRPLPPPTLQFLLESSGFIKVEKYSRLRDYADTGNTILNEFYNSWINKNPDYAIIGHKA